MPCKRFKKSLYTMVTLNIIEILVAYIHGEWLNFSLHTYVSFTTKFDTLGIVNIILQ